MMVAAASTLDQLTEQQQEQVAVILERCMVAMESGQQVDIETCVSEHPELQESLRRCLTSLQLLQHAVSELPSENKFARTPTTGTHLGDFLLHREIGRGGMGVVYAATQVSLNRTVALKVLPESLWLQPKRIRRFQMEAQAAAHLHHPNIIPIYAIGDEGNTRFYAMPLIDGESLDILPKKQWSENSFRPLIDMAIAVGNALQHAHDLGVIHRDIKPSNLIYDRTGKIWVTDFGLAQQVNQPNLTVTGELVGTLNYMSPEQALGEPIDHRTDVYSFAATLYELCTGLKAVHGTNVAETLRCIQATEPTPPRNLQPAVPIDLETILLKGLAKERSERYASIADMVQDLIAVRDGSPIRGQRPSLWMRTQRWISRNPQTAKITAVCGALTSLATLIALLVLVIKQNEVRAALAKSELHRQTAETNYWLGRDLLDKWNSEVIPLLADENIAPSIRQEMLADSIEFYQHYLDQDSRPTDDSLAPSATLTRVQLAEAYASNQQWRQAVDQLELVVKSQPQLSTATPIEYRWHAKALANLGLGYLQFGKDAEAILQLREAGKLYAELLQMDFDESAKRIFQLEQAAVHTNLGQAYRSSGNSLLALEQLRIADSICQQIKATGAYPKSQRLLSQIWDHQATLLANTNTESALKYANLSVDLQRDNIDQIRTHWQRLQRFGTSLHNLAALTQKSGAPEVALVQLKEAESQRELAILLNPNNPDLLNELAVVQNARGMIQADLGYKDEARLSFENAIRQLQTIQQNHTTRWTAKSQIALLNVLINLATISADVAPEEWSRQSARFDAELHHPLLDSSNVSTLQDELKKIRQSAEQLKLSSSMQMKAEQ
jgi:eukaryotic-like serine/threonine-protein kinase